METVNVKEHARKIVDDLKEDSTWDDLMQKIYVRQAIEAGFADSMAGRTTDVHDIRKKFGLSE